MTVAFKVHRRVVLPALLALGSLLAMHAAHATPSQGAGPVRKGDRAGSTAISFRGIGRVRWGARVPHVENVLDVHFDCLDGLLPGRCLCPPSEPDIGLILVFDAQRPAVARLQVVSSRGDSGRTARGIAVGSTKRAVERTYPGARYKVNAPLTSGLSTYLLARHNGHALVFLLYHGRVIGIMAFARGDMETIASEQCA